MFNLEKSIAEWRKQMLAAGIKTPVPLEELEIHLREEIERQMKSGLHEQKAFEISVQQIGQAQELKLEFSKINKSELKEIMKNLRIIPNLSLAAVLLATAWLAFCAVMIGKDLFPQDGLIAMRVSDGAQVQVQNGAPVLLGEGTLSDGGKYHLALIPALAIPFAVVFGFAIIGCRSLFRDKTRQRIETTNALASES